MMRHHSGRMSDCICFAFGRISLKSPLMRGDGLRKPVEYAGDTVGFDEAIFSLNNPPSIASYPFPGRGILTEPTRIGLSGSGDVIGFGDSDTARRERHGQGIAEPQRGDGLEVDRRLCGIGRQAGRPQPPLVGDSQRRGGRTHLMPGRAIRWLTPSATVGVRPMYTVAPGGTSFGASTGRPR